MKTQFSLWLLVTIVLAVVSSAQAQQTTKIVRIGVLEANSAAVGAKRLEALRQGLRDLGHVEGRNITS